MAGQRHEMLGQLMDFLSQLDDSKAAQLIEFARSLAGTSGEKLPQNNGTMPMFEARKFSERQGREIGKVLAFAVKNAETLRKTGSTPTKFAETFKRALHRNPALSAADVIGTKAG